MVKKTLVSISFLSRILSMEGNNIGKKHIVGIFELGAAILYTISLSLFFISRLPSALTLAIFSFISDIFLALPYYTNAYPLPIHTNITFE